jgi:transcriptional regulator with XRE-family HTH domain
MKHQAAGNYLKAHRKKSGLSQRDVGKLLGYKDPGQISRHERATSIPPLRAALAYELVFGAPIATMFSGMRDSIARDVEVKLAQMGATLQNQDPSRKKLNLTAQKLTWMHGRQRFRLNS